LWAVFVERYNCKIANRSVGDVCCSNSCFIDARDHEVVCEFWVKIAEGCSPVSHHSVKVEPPKFILRVAGGSFVEEGREIEWVAKTLGVKREEIAEDAEECGWGAPEIAEVDINTSCAFCSFGFS